MLAKYFSIIRNYVLSILGKVSTLFATQTRSSMLFEQILAMLLVLILSFDGDSLASQSRFYVYARRVYLVAAFGFHSKTVVI